jgi:uncharacterized protein YbbC (DUF1343 family)
MPPMIGLDRLAAQDFAPLVGKRVSVVCNQASVDSQFGHILALLNPGHKEGKFRIQAVFGPQHGLFGTTQDNMIEWEGEGAESLSFPVYSLYGEHREPTDEMLANTELILIDLPDVGSRYYTFMWTMSLVIKAAERLGIPALVLDRPNPIGNRTEGTLLDPDYSSFVGLHPVPTRHGMTMGEVAQHVVATHYPKAQILVMTAEGYDPTHYADQTSYAWVMPSPNMPTVETAVVYPGGCLIEATNLSEGRGTTRPFEIIGAPWIDADRLATDLNNSGLHGSYFRPLQFEPTFNKYKGQICNGVFLHVLDRDTFEPVLAYVALMQCIIRQKGVHDASHVKLERFQATSAETELPGFAWKQPPYEYEYERLPIDILAGNGWLRGAIENQESLTVLRDRFRVESGSFEPARIASVTC